MARKNRENEFAVIGLGRFGVNLARRLEEMGHPVLGIERDPQLAKEMEDQITEVFVLDATNPDALAEADITAFKTVVVAISDDFETNALITSSLKDMGIPNIICPFRIHSQTSRTIVRRIRDSRINQQLMTRNSLRFSQMVGTQPISKLAHTVPRAA